MPDPIGKLQTQVRTLRAVQMSQGPGLEPLLKRRGFIIYKKEASQDLLVPATCFVGRYYSLLHKYSFRLFLRDVIKHQYGFSVDDVARYASPRVTARYIRILQDMKLVGGAAGRYEVARRQLRSFGPTLEWYVAEMLRREFGAEAVWGVKFRRPRVGGDYDVVAALGGDLLYAEVKSSPPKQIYDSEITAFLDRVDDLAPEIAVFLMDTELRMKDKIVPMFEQALAVRFRKPPALKRLERELFTVNDRIFIINSKEEVLQNFQAGC